MLQNPELHYLDNAATTMVAPEVADVIDKAMRELKRQDSFTCTGTRWCTVWSAWRR